MPRYCVHFFPVFRHTVDIDADTPQQAIAQTLPQAVLELNLRDEYTDDIGDHALVDIISDTDLFLKEVGDFPLDPEDSPAPPAAAPILVTLYGGLVQSVEHIPAGQTVIVHDYDCEGADEDELTRDADGKPFIRGVWTNPTN